MKTVSIQNIGWTLGNDCPCKCKHCYSFDVRKKGVDLTKELADRVLSQIFKLPVRTVNIGGNEPIFTSGLDAEKSLLPYILQQLHKKGIDVGITTSGISLVKTKELFPDSLTILNDVDISLDSPHASEHNENRGGNTFHYAIEALEICREHHIHSGIILCAMNWNFTVDRLEMLIELAKQYQATIRINMLKPVEKRHFELIPSLEQVQAGYKYLFEHCDVIDLSEPTLARTAGHQVVQGCSCGTNSMRINSITPDGKIMISPCVYMHDFRVGDLLTEDIMDIVTSKPFQDFAYRKEHYQMIPECQDCNNADICRGGCFAMAYTYMKCAKGNADLFASDPYCTKELQDGSFNVRFTNGEHNLVHQNYLCTCILQPR